MREPLTVGFHEGGQVIKTVAWRLENGVFQFLALVLQILKVGIIGVDRR